MHDRWTQMASLSVLRAQEKAMQSGSRSVTPEHLLLGIVHEGDNAACLLLDRMDINIDQIRSALEQLVTSTNEPAVEDMELSPQAKRAIDLAYKEAGRLHNNYVGTEHLLLGILNVRHTPASTILTASGADLRRIRTEVKTLQNSENPVNLAQPRNTISMILCRQLLLAVDALASSIIECPEEIWDAHNNVPPVWQQAYHAVYWLHYWVRDPSQSMGIPEYHTEEAVSLVESSISPIAREDVSNYLTRIRAQSGAWLETLALIDLMVEREMNGKMTTIADLVIGQISHLRYHIGIIHVIIREQTGIILRTSELGE